jgi:hypothetical protein
VKFTVAQLVDLLQKLPPDTRIFTSGTEGIADFELGNLCPFKVLQTRFGVCLFIDDGLGVHEGMDAWQPLNEFVNAPNGTLQ